MGQYVVSTGTITYAIKGRDLLRSLGYKAYVERRQSGLSSKGCGYVIIFEGNPEKAMAALQRSATKVLGFTTEKQSW